MAEIRLEELRQSIVDVLIKVGVSQKSANIVADTALYANMRGVNTHGVGRLPLYINNINNGCINIDDPILISDVNATAIYDAQNGLGQIASHEAMLNCIEKAKKFGVGIVGVRNSNNFGMASYYGQMATNEGMMAVIMANSAPAMAPTGGKRAVLGTNPICFAVPGNSLDTPIILDMATTVAARGKIRLSAKEGNEIPIDWAVGPDGNPTTDPNKALQGTLLPIGGYKGYGLSLFVDIIAGLIMGSSFAGEVKPLSNFDSKSGNGHSFIVVDLRKFLSEDEYKSKIEHLTKVIKESGDQGTVILPGENWNEMLVKNKKTVNLPDIQVKDVNNILRSYDINELK
ncbi:MAG: Ldh family oxidoreductase [bacterium]